MSDIKDDTGWQDTGHGYISRSYKVENFKPFNLDDMKDTWHLSMPDGKGNVTNTFGRWVDGKMVEDFKETIPDPLHFLKEQLKITK